MDLNIIFSRYEIKFVDFIINILAIADYLQKIDYSGNNDIPSGCLKNCSSQLTHLIEAIFDDVISNLIWSADWKGSYITHSYQFQDNHNELLKFLPIF